MAAYDQLSGPVAMVTGGNRGLGLETCRQLARQGMTVLLTSRDPEAGARAADALHAEGLQVFHLPLDVADTARIDAFTGQLKARGLRLASLVNNAGIALHGFNADVARRTLDVNFYGAMHVTDTMLPYMAEHGRIVMVSSGLGELEGLPPALRARFEDPALSREALIDLVESFVRDVGAGTYARQGWPGSAYRVSKIALNALTRILARELRGSSLHINAVCPGWVQTRMGGSSAPTSVSEGADTIVWAATLPPDGPTGGFFRERTAIPW